MRTHNIDRSSVEFPVEWECQNCESYDMVISADSVKTPPWECGTCGELYLPGPETVKKPTEILIRLLAGNTAPTMECSHCNEEFKQKLLIEQLRNVAETGHSSPEHHLLFQIDRPQELGYWRCPFCNEPEDFYANNRPGR